MPNHRHLKLPRLEEKKLCYSLPPFKTTSFIRSAPACGSLSLSLLASRWRGLAFRGGGLAFRGGGLAFRRPQPGHSKAPALSVFLMKMKAQKNEGALEKHQKTQSVFARKIINHLISEGLLVPPRDLQKKKQYTKPKIRKTSKSRPISEHHATWRALSLYFPSLVARLRGPKETRESENGVFQRFHAEDQELGVCLFHVLLDKGPGAFWQALKWIGLKGINRVSSSFSLFKKRFSTDCKEMH